MTKLILLMYLVFFSHISTAQTCPVGKYWVSAHPRSEYVTRSGVPYSATSVVGHCRSKTKAFDFWGERFKNGDVLGWPYKAEKMKDWTSLEIDLVAKAMEKVPEFLWYEVDLFRSKLSTIPANPASSAKGVLVLYDKALQSESSLPRYLTHELAHEHYRKMLEFDRLQYHQVAGWRKDAERFRNIRKRGFVAPDGDISPEEDFANNVEYFVFESKRLQIKSSEIFDWMSIEYGDKVKAGGKK